jgi:hypothetical protein
MKAKRAIKRLHRAEALLRSVIDRYDAGTGELHDLLDAARSDMASASQTLAALPTKKGSTKANRTQARKLSNSARKLPSVAAKKRWAAAKRKGMNRLVKPSRQMA